VYVEVLFYVGGAAVALKVDSNQLPAGFQIANVDRILAKAIVGTTDVAFDIGVSGAGTVTANRGGSPLFTPVQFAAE